MSERRGRLTAVNRRGLVDELLVLERRHHEEGKVHPTRHVALENGIAHVPAHTGIPWLSPSSRSLPRTTVHRVSLANTRRHASTWSSRSTTRASRAIRPTTFTSTLIFHE